MGDHKRILKLGFTLLFISLSFADRPTGYAWLRIPIGAREAAIGGCGSANATGPQSLVYNPALPATLPPFSIQVNYTKWFLDTHLQSIFLARNLHHFTISLGVVTFTNGKFEYRDERPTEKPLGTFVPLDVTGYFNIARTLGPKWEIGLTGRYFYSKVIDYQANGIGADIGVRYCPIENLSLGGAVVDFGRTLYYKYELFWLPTRIRGGVSYQLSIGSSELNFAIDGSYFIYSKELVCQVGSEFTLIDIVSLRGGYEISNGANRINFGFGIRQGLLRVDYAFSPLSFYLGSAHRFAISFGY